MGLGLGAVLAIDTEHNSRDTGGYLVVDTELGRYNTKGSSWYLMVGT